MAIIRTETATGWKEEATDPKSARELNEKHGPALQKKGAEDFHKKYMQDLSVGFEKVTDPHGNPTYVRADRMEQALRDGYGASNTIRSMVPGVPWEKKSLGPGKHKFMKCDDGKSRWHRWERGHWVAEEPSQKESS